ncbi:MAG: transglycosylase domain-containing protein [Leptospirales bacterium]|nr:transglycosylase domain-containing protein [Leptospirales bacterium]
MPLKTLARIWLTFSASWQPWLAALLVCLPPALFLFLPFFSDPLATGGGLQLYAADGALLEEFRAEDSGAYQEWRTLASYPLFLKRALLVAEDRRFYWHPGVDPVALGRALLTNLRAGRVVSGASTLSQQLARMAPGLRLPRSALARKPLEALFALRLELHYSKAQILEAYLNLAPLARNRQGFAAAARESFGRDIAYLSKAETLVLICLLRRNQTQPELLTERAWQLNQSMHASLDRRDIEEAVRQALRAGAAPSRPQRQAAAPHFSVWLSEKFSGLNGRVDTNIYAEWNQSLSQILNREFASLRGGDELDGALIVLERLPGEDASMALRALVGSRNFGNRRGGQVNGALAHRVAGSALKPFVYALAMERLDLRPYTIVDDSDVTLAGSRPGEGYRARNYDLRYWGRIPARQALAASRNIPAVSLARQLGEEQLFDSLRQAGFEMPQEAARDIGPGLALGVAGASLLELCRAYGAFINGGRLPILDLGRDRRGHSLQVGRSLRLFRESTAIRITDILSDAEERRRSFGARSFLDFPFDAAAKTGTSKDYFDSWAIVYTPRFVVGAWVGRIEGGPMDGVSGASGAARIAQQAMRYVVYMNGGQSDRFTIPGNWRVLNVCRQSGRLAGPRCPVQAERVPPGEPLPPPCTDHGSESATMNGGAPDDSEAIGSAGALDRIVAPLPEEVFYLDPHMPAAAQAVPIQIRISGPERQYLLQVKGQAARTVGSRRLFPSSLQRGRHRVELRRSGEVVDAVEFEVH